jgi:hypothetical protein
MAHIVVRIIELLVAIGLAAAVMVIVAVAVISIVHGLRTVGLTSELRPVMLAASGFLPKGLTPRGG